MDANLSSDSAVTRRVKNDYNTMSNRDFAKKYQTTKNTYRKRVNKYGDPYMNGTKAKYGKALNKKPEDRTAEDKKIIAKETAKAAAKISMAYLATIGTISAAVFVAQGRQEKRISAADWMLEAKRINGKSLKDLSLSDLSKLDLY